jgi:hypothetical protein
MRKAPLSFTPSQPIAAKWRERASVGARQRAVHYARYNGCNCTVTVWKDGRVVARAERKVPHPGGCTWNHDGASWMPADSTDAALAAAVLLAKDVCERISFAVDDK